mmetsp:Transcript_46715/g.146490  ORF Transcript_46715/g.146490 Transcript_46715/m.146490 type:complete len:269 (+) Transcript_46715:2048-2854(+)
MHTITSHTRQTVASAHSARVNCVVAVGNAIAPLAGRVVSPTDAARVLLHAAEGNAVASHARLSISPADPADIQHLAAVRNSIAAHARGAVTPADPADVQDFATVGFAVTAETRRAISIANLTRVKRLAGVASSIAPKHLSRVQLLVASHAVEVDSKGEVSCVAAEANHSDEEQPFHVRVGCARKCPPHVRPRPAAAVARDFSALTRSSVARVRARAEAAVMQQARQRAGLDVEVWVSDRGRSRHRCCEASAHVRPQVHRVILPGVGLD